MVFHWSLSDSKSPQVSRTLLSILAVLNNAVVWMVSTRLPTSKSSSPFSNPLVTVPNAPYYYCFRVCRDYHFLTRGHLLKNVLQRTHMTLRLNLHLKIPLQICLSVDISLIPYLMASYRIKVNYLLPWKDLCKLNPRLFVVMSFHVTNKTGFSQKRLYCRCYKNVLVEKCPEPKSSSFTEVLVLRWRIQFYVL